MLDLTTYGTYIETKKVLLERLPKQEKYYM